MTEFFLPTAKTRDRSMGELPEKVDAIVVGAGAAGLTAAVYLAHHGLKVACFDSHYVAGGCCTQFARGPKEQRFNFDIGVHYIGDCGPEGMMATLLRGVDIEQEFVPMDQDGFDTILLPDHTFRIPAHFETYRNRLVEYFPKEQKGIDRYVRFIQEVNGISLHMERSKGKMGLGMLWKVITQGRLVAMNQNTTIGQFLDTCTQDPSLRAILVGQNGDYGLPPSQVSAILHAGLANHYFRGAYYPSGGGQAISDKMANKIEELGGSIHLRRGVQKILIEHGKVVGIQTEPRKGVSQEVRADIVISGADYKKTLLDLVGAEHLPSDWVTKVQDSQMGGALFATFLGVKGSLKERGMQSTNYWRFDEINIDRLYQKVNQPLVPGKVELMASYTTSASVKDPDCKHHSPEGFNNLEVMTMASGNPAHWGISGKDIQDWDYNKNEKYQELKAEVEEKLIDHVERLFPGVKQDIVFKESATPITHSRFTRASDGTSYGLSATPSQFLENRPGYRTPIAGLYLCGVSTKAGHGVIGALSSGYNAAFRAAKDSGKPFGELPFIHP